MGTLSSAGPDALHVDTFDPRPHQQALFPDFIALRAMGIEFDPTTLRARLYGCLVNGSRLDHVSHPLLAQPTRCISLTHGAILCWVWTPSNGTRVPVL